jgi:hypothetical protein
MDKERLERFSDGDFEQFTIEELLANGTKQVAKKEVKPEEPENKTEEPAKKPPIIIEF